MAEPSVHLPLLSNGGISEQSNTKKSSLSVLLLRLGLKSLIWAIFVFWVAIIFFLPTQTVQSLYTEWVAVSRHTVFGDTGSFFLAFSGPILILAFLAYLHMILFPNDFYKKKSTKFPRYRLWTFPVLVEGPFGVVSAGELIGILLFSIYVIWTTIAYAVEGYQNVSKSPLPTKDLCCTILKYMGFRFGSIGLYCMVFLFLPISRGSVLLRLIDIPFEHATRYHVWLGHLTMAIFSLHGTFFMIAWAIQGRFLEEMLNWKNIGVAILPGVVSLLAGICMWITSFHPVRKNYFELFFYTHQLYLVFILFLAMHVGDFIFSVAAGALFLFALDRFLRFCQSRTKVDIISAACRPCGTIELIFSKPASVRYNALSFIFVQVRELSLLQWHPFSVSSSPLEGKNHLAVLIKVLGGWTEKLGSTIRKGQKQPQITLNSDSCKLTASVEGPYGHEVAYHLKYENLVLVAGGIGISPFLAVLSDILHHIQQKKPCPKHVLVIWAVKKSKELSLLNVVDSQSICLYFSDKLKLDIQAYVTQEQEPSLEEGELFQDANINSFSVTHGGSMSSLVGTGDNLWPAIYFVVSMVSFITIYGLFQVFYIRPYGVSSWWYLGLLLILCMVASVVLFGGTVILLWRRWEIRNPINGVAKDDEKAKFGRYSDQMLEGDQATAESLARMMTIQYGCRPDFREIFTSFGKLIGRADVGVIVCGPPGLQSNVAKECRSQNIKGTWEQPIFHFHSHSFDL